MKQLVYRFICKMYLRATLKWMYKPMAKAHTCGDRFEDEGGHHDFEKEANSVVCDHCNDCWPFDKDY